MLLEWPFDLGFIKNFFGNKERIKGKGCNIHSVEG
jgi:hypothetical protein